MLLLCFYIVQSLCFLQQLCVFIQMYSTAEGAANTRQLIAQRMSVVRSAMPLFTDHLQLPLFTGQRRWHTMFGQLSQLTSSGCTDSSALNADEDILADSNFTSLFDSSRDAEHCNVTEPVSCTNSSPMITESCPTLSENTGNHLTESDFPALDENADSVHSAVEQLMLTGSVCQSQPDTDCESVSVSVTNLERSRDVSSQAVNLLAASGRESAGRLRGSLTASTGSQSRTLHARRYSDPGSIHSGTTGSSSAHSNSDNWYYYDCRLRPGGALAAQYGRLQTRRCLSLIVNPPAYDDVVYNVPVSTTVDQDTTDPSLPQLLTVSESTCENSTELPPPYVESEQPPSYSDISSTAEGEGEADEWLDTARPPASTYVAPSRLSCAAESMTRGCSSQNHAMFVGRPAVRWNRNTRVERWTSSFNWVMS